MESIKKASSDWRTWVLTYFYFVTFGGFIALTVWLPTYWAELFGTGLVRAGLLTAFYSLSASLLRVLGGYASDRMGGEKVVYISFIILGIGSIVMVLASRSSGLAFAGEMILALGMGFANAAVFKLVPKYSPAAVGGAAGIVGGLGAFGGFVTPLIMGLFVKINGQPGYAQGFSVFVVMAALALILFAVLNRYAPKEAVKTETAP
jgi:NNP family nitrate/nitrite transporter-like MFS transporter